MKTYPEKLNPKLKELYKKIPSTDCPHLCSKCCGPVPLGVSEAAVLGKKELMTSWDNETFTCEFSTDQGCSVYNDRPFICRIFGCDNKGIYSCPVLGDKNTLSQEEAHELTEEYFNILVEEGRVDELFNDFLCEAMIKHERIIGFRK